MFYVHTGLPKHYKAWLGFFNDLSDTERSSYVAGNHAY